jgi:hypothetical protein
MADEPLIWTTKGNLPVSQLRYETAWQDSPDCVVFRETYYLGDEVVKQSVHVLKRQGQAAQSEQATL